MSTAEPVKPSQRRGVSTKFLIIAGGALLGFCLLGSCALTVIVIAWTSVAGPGTKNPARADAKIAGGGASKGTAMEVTGKEILNAYEANRIAADEKYKDKKIQIVGAILAVGNNGNDVTVSGNVGTGGFNCFFDNHHKGELGKLKVGSLVAVRGVFVGNFTIEKCDFVEPKPIKMELPAAQLVREVEEDRHFADAAYAGKTLKISGKVDTILGAVSAHNYGGKDAISIEGVYCCFEKKDWGTSRTMACGHRPKRRRHDYHRPRCFSRQEAGRCCYVQMHVGQMTCRDSRRPDLLPSRAHSPN